MANYCSNEDIQVLAGLPTAFSDSPATRPTSTQMQSIIADITNEIDLQLSLIGINTQPTDTRILGKLKTICAYGSAARGGFGYINMSASMGETKPKTFWDIYTAYLKEMIEHPEIYGVVSSTESVQCGYNEDHDYDDGYIISQDWKS